MALGDLFSDDSLNATEQQVVKTINLFHDCRCCMSGYLKVYEMTGLIWLSAVHLYTKRARFCSKLLVHSIHKLANLSLSKHAC